MAMTAPTPMIMPSAVSAERSLFRRRARNATLNVDPTLIFPVTAVYDCRSHPKSDIIDRRYKVCSFALISYRGWESFHFNHGIATLGHGKIMQDKAIAQDDIALGIRGDVRLVGDHHDRNASPVH